MRLLAGAVLVLAVAVVASALLVTHAQQQPLQVHVDTTTNFFDSP